MPDAPITARLVTRPFVVVSVATFAFFAAVGVLMPVLPRYVKDGLGGSNFEVGLLLTAYGVAAVACRPVLTWFAGRFGSRSMMITGGTAGAIVLALHPLARSIAPLVVLRMAMGVSEALLFVGAATIVNELAPAHRRAEAASYFSVAVFAGLGLGPLVGEALADGAHFTRAFMVAAAACATAAVASLAVDRQPVIAVTAERGERRRLLHPAGVVTGGVLALAMVGYTGWAAFLPLRADEVGGDAGGMFLAYSILVLVLRLAGARVPERVGLGRCAAVALVFIGGALVLMSAVSGSAGLWLGTLALGCGISLLYPSLMAITVNAVSDAERPAVIATFTMFFEVGGAIGGVILGGVASFGGYRAAFGVGGLISLVALVPLWTAVLAPRRARSAAIAPMRAMAMAASANTASGPSAS